jgi:hypothetical protein
MENAAVRMIVTGVPRAIDDDDDKLIQKWPGDAPSPAADIPS